MTAEETSVQKTWFKKLRNYFQLLVGCLVPHLHSNGTSMNRKIVFVPAKWPLKNFNDARRAQIVAPRLFLTY